MKWIGRVAVFLAAAVGIWTCSALGTEEPTHYQLTPDGQVHGHTLSDWIKQLKDSNPSIRQSAAEAIKGISPDEAKVAIPSLIPLLRDSAETVRQAAAETLGGFGSDARPAIHGLIQRLSDPVEPVRNAAAAALYYVGINRDRQTDPEPEKALQLTMQTIFSCRDRPASIRTQLMMVNTLGTFACLDSPHFRPCQNLTAPAVHDQSIRLLIDIIQNRQLHSLVRERACTALGAFRKQARGASPVLASLLRQTDEDAGLRTAAIDALVKLGATPETVKVLVQALQDKDLFVRRDAAWALGELGLEARAALPDLWRALNDSDSQTRGMADKAIERITSPTAASTEEVSTHAPRR